MKTSYASLIADRVKYYRNFLRLPQTFVAEILEIDRTTYSRMESGKPELSASDLKVLANLFHVSIEDFFEPLKINTGELKALTDSAQYRLDKEKDYSLPDDEGINSVGQAARDLLAWSEVELHHEELATRQKKTSESYKKFKSINEALSACTPLIKKHMNGNSLDIYRLIIDEFGCWVSWNSFGAFSGIYLEKNLELAKNIPIPLPIIGINSIHSSERQRFSAAHELAHHLLGRKGKYGSPTKYVSDPEEKEANQFAAELLMDKGKVLEIMANLKKLSQNKIEQNHLLILTASQLQVSFSALVNRLINIGEIPFEKRAELQNVKVSELQKKSGKQFKEQEFREQIIPECEKTLKAESFYRTDEVYGGPRGLNDLRFLQDYSYIRYIQECKTKHPLDSNHIFTKVVSYVSDHYPRYKSA